MEAVEIVGAQLAILAVALDEMIADHQNVVGNRQDGSFLPSACCQPVILGSR